MKIVWFSWKDIKHPEAGGAEAVSHTLMSRLASEGHEVTLITSRPASSTSTDEIDGVKVLRAGNKFTVYMKARGLYRQLRRDGLPDLVIDEMNTIPFATTYYSGTRTVLLTYQLARQVWFYQMVFPISVVGYILEPLYLRLISKRYETILTESLSTKNDLIKHGFPTSRIHTFRVSINTPPLLDLQTKNNMNEVLFLGAFRPMKRPLHAIEAFEYARDANPGLILRMAGNNTSAYGRKVTAYAQNSRHAGAIEILGRVSDEERLQLMRQAAVIVVTSIKEGWGLIVTEANSQGTPAVAYDTDGVRDSVKNSETGLLSKNSNARSLGQSINKLLSDSKEYGKIRNEAWEFSKQFTVNNLYNDFHKHIK